MKKTKITLLIHSRIIILLVLLSVLMVIRQAAWIGVIDNFVYVQAMNLSYSIYWLKFCAVVTLFGSGFFVKVQIGVLFLMLFWRYREKKIILYIFVAVLLFVVVPLIKELFALERPVCLAPFYPALHSYTFPSGHAFNGVLLFYYIPRFLLLGFSDKKAMIYGVSFFLKWPVLILGVLLIAMSRVCLGVHWFSDVVGGVVLGFLVSDFLLLFYEKLQINHIRS